MDVTLMWFECMDANCDYVPTKDKKVRQDGKIKDSIGKRTFLRYVEGYYRREDNGNLIYFVCKHGDILMLDMYESVNQNPNSYITPLKGIERCGRCQTRLQNESALFQ